MFPMDERDIGKNIRRIREQAGQTVTATAGKAGLTKSTLSKIEKGQVSPPISTLVRVAAALQVELASFFTTAGPRPTYAYTPQGKGRILTRDGSRFGYAYEALALDMPGKRGEPFVLTIQPGDPAGEFAHDGQEFIYMLSGSMAFSVGEETFTLRKGDSLYFNATVHHRTRVLGKQAVRFVCVFIEDASPSSPIPTTHRPTRRGRPGDSPA